jgi:acyl-coenzyme A synthetase/AMP-(fatty) acid ligase
MNSLAGHLNLFAHCDCQNIVAARGISIDDLLSSRPMRHIKMPELNELLNEEVVPHYLYEKTFEQARLDPYLVLHTSGSTGLPKPIILNHAFIAAVDATLNTIPDMSAGRPTLKKSTDGTEPVRIFSPFAPFHVISATQMMAWTVFGNTIYVFGPLDRMTTPQDAVSIFTYANVKKAWCSPAMLETFATIPSAMESLSKLSMVMYGGGGCTFIPPCEGLTESTQVPYPSQQVRRSRK